MAANGGEGGKPGGEQCGEEAIGNAHGHCTLGRDASPSTRWRTAMSN